jgi:phospholipase/carboxylesterase
MTFTTYTHPPKSGQKPKSMVILLHGLGANGQDLIDLARYWERALPDTIFLSPDAPFACDMAPYGYQWFSLQSWSPQSILKGAQDVTSALQDYIYEMLAKYDVPPSKLALAGFSQGTMMSLYAAPRMKDKIAGVLGYCGALVGAETLGDLNIHKIPVHLIHGDMDMVVPLAAYHMAKAALDSNGFEVSGGITKGLPHSIDEAGITSGGSFLAKILSPSDL